MVQDMNLRNGTLCKNAVLAMVAIVAAVMVALGAAVFVGTTEAYADQQAFTTTSKGNSGETWIYVDGQNGNDSNDGKSADKAVKTWEKAKNLLGCNKGGIIVKGTVDASGVISTNDPDSQVVKRDTDIVMFNVSGEATFASINVDGEDEEYDSEVIHPNGGSQVNFLSGASFHNIGYVTDKSPYDYNGGMVLRLCADLKIYIDGASFCNNNGKGIFYTSLPDERSPITLEMISGEAKNNQGWFYHNESDNQTSNLVYIYNALIAENDASSDYRGDKAAVWLCNQGRGAIRSVEGVAIFDNYQYDLMNVGEESRFSFQGEKNGQDWTHHMLGDGSPNWEQGQLGTGYDASVVFTAHPTDADKQAAIAAAKSIFTDNKSQVIHSNGTVQFGHYEGDSKILTPPSVTPDQGCDGDDTPGTDTPGTDTPGTDTPGTDTPGTDTPGTDTPGTDTPGTDTPGDDTPEETTQTEEKDPTNTPSETPSETTEVEEKEPQNNPAGTDEEEKEKPSQAAPSKAANANNSQSTPSKSTTPKTADGAGTAIVSLAALAALAMATGVYSLRRREER